MTAKVPSGYKQTEVGVIPEDWEVKPLIEVATIATGNTPPTSVSANYGDEYFFVSPADLGEHKYILDAGKKLSQKGFGISRKFPSSSVLFTCIGSTIGKCGIAPIELTSNQQINAIFPDKSFSSEYLYYELSFLSPRIKALAGEQAVPLINKTQFSESPVALPPLPEQRAIATALSDVDALLAAQEKLIAKKRDIKQAAMQQLLTGKQRLPGFSGEWEVKRLGDVSLIKTGKKNNEDKIEEGAYPFFVRSQTVERINSYCFDGEAILVPGEGNIGSIFHYINGKFDYHQRVYKISDFDVKTSGKFIYFCMLQTFNDHAMRNSVKATVDSLRLPTFKEFEFVAPPTIEEQTAIAAVLSDMDAELTALEQQRDKTRVVKLGMMQELLTGRIRLV